MTCDDPGTTRDTGSHSHEASATPLAVTELIPASTGRWAVTSRGSWHLIDLDERAHQRRPGAASTAFAYDRTSLQLLRIDVWPAVGGRLLVWLQDPVHAHLEHWRISSTIRNIAQHADPS